VKDPFVEMVKMSMATFINAMTYSDKTVYPVASNVRQISSIWRKFTATPSSTPGSQSIPSSRKAIIWNSATRTI